MNRILIFLLDCDLEISEDDLWDECKQVNLFKYLEVIKCKKYEEILKKLENVKMYEYEVLYFEITKRMKKVKCLYTSIYRYMELENMWEIATYVDYYRGVGFNEGEFLCETEKHLGDFVIGTLIYDYGTEEEAYRKQMRANTETYEFFIYKNKVKTTFLDINFSIELENQEKCKDYIENIKNSENEEIQKSFKARLLITNLQSDMVNVTGI